MLPKHSNQKNRFPARRAKRLLVSLRAWLLILASVPAIGLGGCVFTPRDPGSPNNEPVVEWDSPDELDKIMKNIRVTFAENAMTNYGRSFMDADVVMTFDPADEPYGDPTQFQVWNGDKEAQHMRGIIPEDLSKIELTWDIPDDYNEESSTEWWFENLGYRLVFEDGAKQVVYEGQVDMWFRNDGGLWYISKWLDQKKPGSSNNTWGYLRLKNVIEWP